MSASLDLVLCKKNLADAVGDDMKIYLQILKSWFRKKIAKEDFDHEARKMLNPETMRDTSSSAEVTTKSPGKSKKEKNKRRKSTHRSGGLGAGRTHFQQRFVPANPLQQALPVNLPTELDERGLAFASSELLLPDIGMVHGRMIVTAWDFGMENVEDNAVQLIMQGVQNALKNILMVVLARRNAYHLREGKFRYGFGSQLPQTTYRNAAHISDDTEFSEATSISCKGTHMPSVKPSVETGARNAAVHLACTGEPPPRKPPITLFDLFEALQVHKSAIPSHTVYATNMERIINRLWHPSNEDTGQEYLHQQELAIKHRLLDVFTEKKTS